MKGTSPTQRTHAYLKERGMLVANCERKMPATAAGWRGPLVTQDLFGILDTIALDPTANNAMLCIQSTSGAGHNARWVKIMESDVTPVLLRHARLELWSWTKPVHRWVLRRERFGLQNNGRVLSWPSTDPLNL